MGIIAEIVRRNLPRTIGAYFVAGWLLIESSSTIAPMLNLPQWLPNAILYAILLGLPIVIFIAWHYQISSEGLKAYGERFKSDSGVKTSRPVNPMLTAALIAALIYIAYDTIVDRLDKDAADAQGASSVISIAVLPFVNMSSDPEQEFFSDGISEEILNVLSRIEELQVTSRSSAFALKGQDLSIPEIAQRLGVNYLLEGSVRKSGDKVRITAQLIQANTDAHLWSEAYDRDLSDIFAVQDEMAQAIAGALQVNLLPQSTDIPTTNMEAYNYFLKGRGQWISREQDEIFAGIENLKRAIDLDPNFAEAYASIAVAYNIAQSWTDIDEREAAAKSREYALNALALDNNAGEAFLALSKNNDLSGNTPLTDYRLVRRAYELDPQNTQILTGLAMLEFSYGYLEKAYQTFSKARKLDPLVGHLAGWHAYSAFTTGRYEEALASVEESNAVGWYIHDYVYFDVYWQQQEYDKAISILTRFIEESFARFEGHSVLEELATLEEHMALVNWFRKKAFGTEDPGPAPYDPNKDYMRIDRYFLVNETEYPDAFAVVRSTNYWAPSEERSARLNSMAFKNYIHRSGVFDLWKTVGSPDLCQINGDDFVCE